MRLSRATKLAYLAMTACVIMAGLVRPSADVIRDAMGVRIACIHFLTYTWYALLIVIWLRLLRYRILSRPVRRYMAAAALLMLAWLLVRTVKYELSRGSNCLTRYLWYAYYVGYTFIPALLMLSVLHIGKRSDETVDRRCLLLLAGALVLSVLVLTNDLHFLAFRFKESFSFAESSDLEPYFHGPVSYLVWGWLFSLGVAGVVVALVRCGRTVPKRLLLIPLGILAIGIAYVLAELFPFAGWADKPYKTAEFTCFMSIAFMESLVALGLFPTNDRYAELWRSSSLRGVLINDAGETAYAAANAPIVPPDLAREALEHPVMLSDDEELVCRRVCGGYACWVRDLTQVHHLQSELEELGDTLADENAVLAAENDLAHERESVAQRQNLYRAITSGASEQLSRLDSLLSDMPDDEDAFLAVMRAAAVEATYLKRRANLMLLGEEGAIEVRELALALEESAIWLRENGVQVRVRVSGNVMLSADDALRAYEQFQHAAEKALKGTSGCLLDCCLERDGLHIECHDDTPLQGGGAL